jgi:hypothetical protein
MIFLDIIFVNIYKFLRLTRVSLLENLDEIKVQAKVIFCGLIGLNFFNLLSISYFLILNKVLPLYYSIVSVLLGFVFVFIFFNKNNRFEKVINSHLMKKNYFHICMTIVTIALTFYLMLKTGDLIRDNLKFH